MLILLLLALSVFLGWLLRRVRALAYLDHTSTWTVWLLILVFGISLGSDKTIVNDFGRFDLTAAAVALAGVIGSVLASWIAGRFVDRSAKR